MTASSPTDPDHHRPRRLASIRFRITMIAAVGVTAVLGLAAITVLGVLDARLTESMEDSLEQRAQDLVNNSDDDLDEAVSGPIDEEQVSQLTDGDIVRSASESLGDQGPLASTPGAREISNPLGEGSSYLLVTIRTGNGQELLHVGADLGDVDEATEALLAALLVAIPLAVISISILVWILVGRTLRPVEEIRSTVAGITGDQLDLRVHEPKTGDEIGRLAATMNAMLERVESASDEQNRFVADASHELRTPLTRMRTELEVELITAPLALRGTLESILEETESLQTLVEDLLQLARTTGTSMQLERTIVDLDDLLGTELARTENERCRIEVSPIAALQVRGSATALTRLIRNLVDNALRHADSKVAISLQEVDGDAVLEVTDDGCGVPVDQREEIFGRFTRLDDSRTQGSGGFGLGLPIVRDIASRHGGSVAAKEPLSGGLRGARIQVRLPLVR